MTHWTQVLGGISVAEFVALAVLTSLQWVRHRIRGAGWAALAFAILGGLALAVKVDPSMVTSQTDQNVAKSLVALIALMPYCLFRLAASFRRPGPVTRGIAAGLTAGIIVFTYGLPYLPLEGTPPPSHFLAYRAAFLVQTGFLLGYVVVRFARAGAGVPLIAATRMRLLAVAVAGLEVLVVVAALGLRGAKVTLASQVLFAAIGVLFLVALVFPSLLRMVISRREDAFRQAMSELVAAGEAREAAQRLLPHVCALVGASRAALLRRDGTVVAGYPYQRTTEHAPWEGGKGQDDRILVRTNSGARHELVVMISPYMPYFGGEELRKLDQLAGMGGLAIERCDMAEAMAYQASHDGLTGLANRSLFAERLTDALSHVGRRRRALAVLFVDLDRFKLVNDRADHTAGDMVLNEMADRLAAMTRGVDVVARFGGDEFVAFAEVDREEEAVDLAERIRQGLAAPISIGDLHLSITASVGVVMTTDPSATPGQLLRDADNAMYDAKRAGRDQVVFSRSNARDVARRKWGMSRVRAERATAS